MRILSPSLPLELWTRVICGRRDEVLLMSSHPVAGGISILGLDNHALDILGKLRLANHIQAAL